MSVKGPFPQIRAMWDGVCRRPSTRDEKKTFVDNNEVTNPANFQPVMTSTVAKKAKNDFAFFAILSFFYFLNRQMTSKFIFDLIRPTYFFFNLNCLQITGVETAVKVLETLAGTVTECPWRVRPGGANKKNNINLKFFLNIVPFPGLYFNFNVILFALDEMEEDEKESVTRLVFSDDWSRRHRRTAVVVSTRDGGKLAVNVLDAYSGVIRTTAVLGPQQQGGGGGMLDGMFPPFHMQACKIAIF